MSKICSKCKIEKPLTEFNVCKAAKDGLQSRCKACIKDHGREYYQTHKAERPERPEETISRREGTVQEGQRREQEGQREEQREEEVTSIRGFLGRG